MVVKIFALPRGSVLRPAQYVLQKEINERLRSCATIPRLVWAGGCQGGQFDLPTRPDHHFRIVLAPTDLLSAMWLQFTKDVAGVCELRQCAWCGEHFQAGPGGKRSHSRTCKSACRKQLSRHPKGKKVSMK